MTLENRAVDLKHIGAGRGDSRLPFCSPDRSMTYPGLNSGAVSPYALLNVSPCALLNDVERDVTVMLDKEMPTPLPAHLSSTLQRNDNRGLFQRAFGVPQESRI